MSKNQILSRLRAKGYITDEEYRLLKEDRPIGKWVWEEEWLPSTTEHPAECQYAEWRCNQCHETPTDTDEWEDDTKRPTLKFCPNCGADMRKETKNETL